MIGWVLFNIRAWCGGPEKYVGGWTVGGWEIGGWLEILLE
jgi:hypothetical protein